MSLITIKKAANILDVSEATVRNWIKHGYLHSTNTDKQLFEYEKVSLLKDKIEKGEINRLRKRANKRQTEKIFVPDEYINDANFLKQLQQIRSIYISNKLNLEITLYTLALKLLELNREVIIDSNNLLDINSVTQWNRESIKKEILSWHSELSKLNKLEDNNYFDVFNALSDSSHDDTLGIVYQSLLNEGKKSQIGTYYTPVSIIDDIVHDFNDKSNLFIDPCCGTGQFLIRAIRCGFDKPENLFGFDIDPIAVKIARINILLMIKDTEFTPNIEIRNTLKEVANNDIFSSMEYFNEKFDYIATNPPWGSKFDKKDVKLFEKLYPIITSGESFSLFLIKAFELVKKHGQISFILPDSILNIKSHREIREFLLNNTTIDEISHLGRRFKGVFSKVIKMNFTKSTPLNNHKITVINDEGHKYSIFQSRFRANQNFIMDTTLNENEYEIIKHLKGLPHVTLLNQADWALGIVTGNNEKFLSITSFEGAEPIYKGSDVKPFRLSEPKTYIRFEPKLYQQVAPEAKYRSPEKLIYKFISNSLIFAYDTQGSLTLNSANICIPKIKDYPIKLLLGLLNSKLYQFLFAKLFQTHKVLRGDLESLPFPLIQKNYKVKIIELVDKGIDGQEISKELNSLIIEAVGLSTDQKKIIIDWKK